MEIGESRQGELLVLHPVGRLDSLTSGEFQTRLLAAVGSGAANVVVDFSAVEYISSAGLRALMAAAKLKAPNCRVSVAALNETVREIFTISRFLHVLPVLARVEDAAKAQEPQPAARPPLASNPQAPIRVRFWGTRGSLPAPLSAAGVRAKVCEALFLARGRSLQTREAIAEFVDRELPFSLRGTWGGNTSCVELAAGGDDYILCDLGSGVREFGTRLLAQHGPGRKHRFHVFLSHVHWDHIMGFPFFPPAYIPGNVIRVYGCETVFDEALRQQQSYPCFPVDFGSLGATIEFVRLEPGRPHAVAGLSVTAIKQFHGGDSYGYRFSVGGKTIVYSTDCEHKYEVLDESYPFVSFYRDADLLIFDSMYSLSDAISVKEDWGHSSNIAAVELAQFSRVKRLALFHHEPAYDDRMIETVLHETIRFEELSRNGHRVEVISAYDGLELTI